MALKKIKMNRINLRYVFALFPSKNPHYYYIRYASIMRDRADMSIAPLMSS